MLLLPDSHEAVQPIKQLLVNVPKFDLKTPVPPTKTDLVGFHSSNLSACLTFLCRNNLPIPDNFGLMERNPKNMDLVNEPFCETLSFDHPFRKLRRILDVFNLVIIPADKIKSLVILSESILKSELQYHLSDKDTYTIIDENEHLTFFTKQKETVLDAVSRYKNPLLLVSNPSMRYLYFLPKIHKDPSEWRVRNLHPKMRPIVSDSNSITYKLSKFLLPKLQILEKSIITLVPSSIAVCRNIKYLNDNMPSPISPTMATIDVESLFTRICQDKLLDIINVLLMQQDILADERQYFIEYLSIIIKFNTFRINNVYCLQRIGLPMGGVLSSCLANIYLGSLEKEILDYPGLLLYNRYMDDILVIATFTDEEIRQFIDKLKSLYQLSITSTSNKHIVNFLDMSISYSPSKEMFFTYPFSKNRLLYPTLSILAKRSFRMDVNIVLSQILRTWRISNNNKEFSNGVNSYLSHLLLSSAPLFKRVRKSIFRFLLPVKLMTHYWTTNFSLCAACVLNVQLYNLSIEKVFCIDGKYVSVKIPANCKTSPIHVILKKDKSSYIIHVLPSIHWMLQNQHKHFANSTLLPLGSLNCTKLTSHPTVQHHLQAVLKTETITYPCPMYDIFRNTQHVYQVPFISKKMKNFDGYFNKHKYLLRR